MNKTIHVRSGTAGFFIFLCILLLLPLWAHCAAEPLLPRHAFELGISSRYFDYEEPEIGIGIDGFLYGIAVSSTFHDQIMLETDLELSCGELEYDGQTMGGTPVIADTRDWLFEGRSLIGLDIALNTAAVLTPFAGLGLRYWNDDIRSPGGYEREITSWYLPLGGRLSFRLAQDWLCTLSGEYDVFLDGTVKSHLSDVAASLNDPRNDQDEGYGWKASLEFKRSIGLSNALAVQAFVNFWDIEKSDPEPLTSSGIPLGLAFEPKNETLSSGLRINWQF